MRFSVWPSTTQPWSDVLAVATHAEATGWDGVYIADHFMADGEQAGGTATPMLEGTALLAALAVATERIRLGSLVFGITYRHPAVLAKWATTVDHVSGGRLLLGLGAGWQENEHEQYGIELGSLGERVDRFAEALEVISGLLTKPVTNVQGKHYRLTDALAEPKPSQGHLPLLIGAKGDRMLGLAARYADEWNLWGLPDWIADRSAVFDARCEEIDRDPAAIARSCQALWFLHDDQAKADALIERVAPRPAVGGPLDKITEVVAGWAEVGIDEVIVPDFTLGTGTQKLDRLDRIIEGIAPSFR